MNTASLALAASLLFVDALSVSGQTQYSSGHSDLAVAYEDGGLHLHYHFDPGTVLNGIALTSEAEFNPSNVLVYFPGGPDSRYDVPETPFNSSWGVPPDGGNLYYLPQVQDFRVPWLGFGTDELNPANFQGGFTFKLVGYEGPGEFSMWSTGVFGEPSFYFSTNDPASTVTGNNTLNLGFTHAHYNWGFTEPGVYEVTLQVSANSVAEGLISDTQTITFGVAAVPEPTSALLVGLGGLYVVGRRRRLGV
jgi:surface-anchored protein